MAEPPLQITVGVATTVNVGIGFTVTSTVCVLIHMPVVPVIVYVVFTIGVTTTLLPVKAPGFHK